MFRSTTTPLLELMENKRRFRYAISIDLFPTADSCTTQSVMNTGTQQTAAGRTIDDLLTAISRGREIPVGRRQSGLLCSAALVTWARGVGW